MKLPSGPSVVNRSLKMNPASPSGQCSTFLLARSLVRLDVFGQSNSPRSEPMADVLPSECSASHSTCWSTLWSAPAPADTHRDKATENRSMNPEPRLTYQSVDMREKRPDSLGLRSGAASPPCSEPWVSPGERSDKHTGTVPSDLKLLATRRRKLQERCSVSLNKEVNCTFNRAGAGFTWLP